MHGGGVGGGRVAQANVLGLNVAVDEAGGVGVALKREGIDYESSTKHMRDPPIARSPLRINLVPTIFSSIATSTKPRHAPRFAKPSLDFSRTVTTSQKGPIRGVRVY